MFLIQYQERRMVDAEKIDWISVNAKGVIQFTMTGDIEGIYDIDEKLSKGFLNKIQAINSGVDSCENIIGKHINNKEGK